MKYWTEYTGHDVQILGRTKKIDNTIYTFDIETTSYLILDDKIIPASNYPNMSEDDQKSCNKQACMYIWQFSINDQVYYGRTWYEFKVFLDRLEQNNNSRKIIFIHNLSFEFQFLWSVLNIKDVMSRKSRHLIKCELEDYNIELRCTAQLSGLKLEYIPDVYKLPVKKLVGNLDYSLLRTPATPLTEKELSYCEHDCLVTYQYILRELETYERVDKLPLTSTGKVRKQLQKLVLNNMSYVRKVGNQINTNPRVYNMLVDAFAGGYTHANYIYADKVLKNVDSYDETSAYPYVLVTHKFPSSQFVPCRIKTVDDMIDNFAYLLTVRFKRIKCKYLNNFISSSKCLEIKGKPNFDNGRIITAKEITITLTDVDFRFLLDAYECESYEIIECYRSVYNYLPIEYVNFILDKYVLKTKLKNVEGKDVEYAKEKGAFNALYGMTVTNTICADVSFVNSEEWVEKPLTNQAIMERLSKDKKRGFLNFAWGVWCTAHARDNLLRRVLDLDEKAVYMDTDSCKVIHGYDKSVFDKYNASVEAKIRKVSKERDIPFERFAPEDIKGNSHLLGVFECETGKGRSVTYDEFITQGAKKYAYTIDGDIHITVSGVPKTKGAECLTCLDDFRDDLVFDFEHTNKLTVAYNDNQKPIEITDYLGNKYTVKDKSGSCMLPTTYKLGKALDYADLIDNSNERAKFNI